MLHLLHFMKFGAICFEPLFIGKTNEILLYNPTIKKNVWWRRGGSNS